MSRREKNQWDEARRSRLTGVDPYGSTTLIDPGVNFFVLALLHLGAGTLFSCAGHPAGFYVMFKASEKLARRVTSAGYLNVEILREARLYCLRLREVDHIRGEEAVLWTEVEKREVLRLAADAWWKEFGPFPFPDKLLIKAPGSARFPKRRKCEIEEDF